MTQKIKDALLGAALGKTGSDVIIACDDGDAATDLFELLMGLTNEPNDDDVAALAAELHGSLNMRRQSQWVPWDQLRREQPDIADRWIEIARTAIAFLQAR